MSYGAHDEIVALRRERDEARAKSDSLASFVRRLMAEGRVSHNEVRVAFGFADLPPEVELADFTTLEINGPTELVGTWCPKAEVDARIAVLEGKIAMQDLALHVATDSIAEKSANLQALRRAADDVIAHAPSSQDNRWFHRLRALSGALYPPKDRLHD